MPPQVVEELVRPVVIRQVTKVSPSLFVKVASTVTAILPVRHRQKESVAGTPIRVAGHPVRRVWCLIVEQVVAMRVISALLMPERFHVVRLWKTWEVIVARLTMRTPLADIAV